MIPLRAYLQLARLSNLPTVWTGTLVGIYAGYTAALVASHLAPHQVGLHLLLEVLNQAFFLLIALSCLYAAGMVLNDVLDEAVDHEQRPSRPIPSGRVSRSTALRLAIGLLILGVLGLSLYNPLTTVLGLALTLSIVGYNILHHRTPWAILLMGLCRSLVYLTAAAAVPVVSVSHLLAYVAPFAICVGVYTTILTLIARRETGDEPGPRKWLAVAMPVIALAPTLMVRPAGDAWLWVVLAAFIVIAWLSRASIHVLAEPPRTVKAILAWLSGLCFVDAYYLALLSQPEAAVLAAAGFLLTLIAHRRIPGT